MPIPMSLTPAKVTDPLPILRRVGWLLIVLGALDIGVMIYCLVNQIRYASSLNVFAVAAGVFLLRGHLGAVRYVIWSSAFAIAGALALVVVLPVLRPVGYLLLLIRSQPWLAASYALFSVGLLLLLFFVYNQLRLPAVEEARAKAGHALGAPRSAFVAGFALVALLAAVLHRALNGEVAQQAKHLAEQQYGRDYDYFVSSIRWNGDRVTADVTAYKHDDTKELEIDLE